VEIADLTGHFDPRIIKQIQSHTENQAMKATTTKKYAQLASHLADRLERRTRRDGSAFLAFRDPDAFTEAVVRAAHEAIDGSDPRQPSDWTYEVLSDAIDAIADNGGDIDGASRYVMPRSRFFGYSDAFRWLASHHPTLIRRLADECGISGRSYTHHLWQFANEAVNLATVRVIDALAEIADNTTPPWK
jgi:hypothetical protein